MDRQIQAKINNSRTYTVTVLLTMRMKSKRRIKTSIIIKSQLAIT